MSSVTADARVTSGTMVHRTRVLGVSWAIAVRSLNNIVRIPAAFVPILAMPIFFVIAFSGSFSSLTNLPSFPTDNILNWMVPFAMLQGSAFAGFASGFAMVRDIDTGFYDRMLLAPGTRAPLFVGPIIASVVRASITVAVVTTVGLLFGMDVPGPLGFFTLWLGAIGIAIAATGWALGVVYRMPGPRSGPILQIGIFFSMFLSTGNVPVEDQTGWTKPIAAINPITYVLELARQGFLEGVTWATTWPGLLALAGMILGLWAFAVRGIRRLTR